MRKFLLFFLLSVQSFAANVPWPSQLFSSDQLVYSFLLPFQNYFRQLEQEMIVVNLPDGRIFTSTDRLYSFRISVLEDQNKNEFSQTMVFYSNNSMVNRITLTRRSDVAPLSMDELISLGVWPAPGKSELFEVTVSNLGYSMKFELVDGIKYGALSFYNGEFKILLNEQDEVAPYFKTLWYVCRSCNGEKLIANAYEYENELQFKYRLSNQGNFITPQEFYEIQNTHFFPPILSSLSSHVMMLSLMGWPATGF